MQRRLKWNAIGLETKTRMLLADLNAIMKGLDTTHVAKIKKVQGLIDEMSNLVGSIDKIKENLIPRLENRFRLQFKTPELLYLALSRPGISVIISNLELFYQAREKQPIKPNDYSELKTAGQAGDTLALIGDAAISLAIVETLWDSTMATVGKLSIERANTVSNKNLSRLCDELQLYEHKLDRIQLPNKQDSKEVTIIHEKGTLIEAIFGVVYLEFGFEELGRLVPLLH